MSGEIVVDSLAGDVIGGLLMGEAKCSSTVVLEAVNVSDDAERDRARWWRGDTANVLGQAGLKLYGAPVHEAPSSWMTFGLPLSLCFEQIAEGDGLVAGDYDIVVAGDLLSNN